MSKKIELVGYARLQIKTDIKKFNFFYCFDTSKLRYRQKGLYRFFGKDSINFQSNIIYSPTSGTSQDVPDVPSPTPLRVGTDLRKSYRIGILSKMPSGQNFLMKYSL